MAHLKVAAIFLLFIELGSMAKRVEVQDFFPDVAKNLSLLRWDHAVNNKTLLDLALQNDNEMIEADVFLGKVIDGDKELIINEDNVIMSHPPIIISDLTLKEFLSKIVEHNNKKPKNMKGVKLDFKSSKAFSIACSKSILLDETEIMLKPEFLTFPLWINGDIMKGPGMHLSLPVDLQIEKLIEEKKSDILNAVTWSLGWTTGRFSNSSASYTKEHIDAMLSQIEGIESVTFPVRAMFAARSLEQMNNLFDHGTITIWSGKEDDDHVDVKSLIQLIDDNVEKVFVDVPETLEAKIKQVRGSAEPKAMVSPLLTVLCVLFFSQIVFISS